MCYIKYRLTKRHKSFQRGLTKMMTTVAKTHKPAASSYSAISKAVNSQVAKSVIEGKQAKVRFSQVSVFHGENCRNVFDDAGKKHVKAALDSLKNNKPLKSLTLTAIEFDDGTKGVKVIDGFHSHEATKQFISYLKDNDIEKVKIGNTTYTNSEESTFLPVDILELDTYQQDIYKLSSQQSRKNDPIELITFIDRMMKEHNKTLPEIAKEINKPESTIKNLLILLNADNELITLIKNGEIKASRAAALMRITLKQNGIDGRKKNVDLKKVDFSQATKLAQKEISIYNGNTQDETPVNTQTELTSGTVNTVKSKPVTRQNLKPKTLSPTAVKNLEDLINLLAEREAVIDGDIATINIHTSILAEIKSASSKIHEKNEHNNNLLDV